MNSNQTPQAKPFSYFFVILFIFPAFWFPRVLNTIAGEYDGEKTNFLHFLLPFLMFLPVRRINKELERRHINYRIHSFFCNPLTLLIGWWLYIPVYISYYQIIKAVNLLYVDYMVHQ